MAGSVLRIGILADTSLQQHSLRRVVSEFGFTVGVCRLLPQLGEQQELARFAATQGIDAWLLEVDLAGVHEWLDTWLDSVRVPVIFGDGLTPSPAAEEYVAWSRRLREKLQQLEGTINLERQSVRAARRLWVLGASTGGPQAVHQFLCALPPAISVGFIYVQHIDAEFDKTLAEVIAKGTHYTAKLARHGDIIGENEIVVVANSECVEISRNATLALSGKAWSGPYRPSIDQVVANVAHTYGDGSGVIIFTGMGDDGASGARLMHQQGGQVWAQVPDTCTSSSMPDSALATGCVSYTGTPRALAARLVDYMKSAHDAVSAQYPPQTLRGQKSTL